jgi:hypothetical protein
MISETHHFGQRDAVVASRINPADFTDGGEGTFRLDDQAGELDDPAAIFQDANLLCPLDQAPEPVRRIIQ